MGDLGAAAGSIDVQDVIGQINELAQQTLMNGLLMNEANHGLGMASTFATALSGATTSFLDAMKGIARNIR